MQISGSWTAVLPSGQVTGSWSAEVPTDRIADAIAARVAAQLGPSGRPAESRYVDFPPADVQQHRHRGPRYSDDDGLSGTLVGILVAVGSLAAAAPLWSGWLW